jgi:hypothetical protein
VPPLTVEMTWGETKCTQARFQRQRDKKVAFSPSRPVLEINQVLVKANVFYRLDKTKIDCARQKFGIFVFYFYDQNEKQIGSMPENVNPQLFDIPPNSVFENLLTFCKTK